MKSAPRPGHAIGAREFDALMRAVGPFEPCPTVAVAVSGGADSLALAVLAHGWARRRGGTALGLTVDHRLRPESGREARQVGRWLSSLDMRHHILRWDQARPATGIEAAAREARYALLDGWCRRHGVLHLLLAHHRDDQAETFLMRLARGSGPVGLAGMAPITETASVRLLRPLLAVPGMRLRATLENMDQPWIEDPSNQDAAFTRVRIRQMMPRLAAAGLAADAIASTARKMALGRAELEYATATLLAEAVEIYPTGYARIQIAPILRAPEMVATNALAATVTCVGGRAYGPRRERLERLYVSVRDGGLNRGRTLSGCSIARRKDHLLVARESSANIETLPLAAGMDTTWDGRYRVRVAKGAHISPGLQLDRLGDDGWARLVQNDQTLRHVGLPAAVRASLPAVRDRRRVVFVPAFPNVRLTRHERPPVELRFSPANALAKSMFSVV